MHLNLSFYFKLYAISSFYALYHLSVVIASPLTPIIQCVCYFPSFLFQITHPTFYSNLSTKLLHFRPFCTISFAFCYSQHHSYRHTLRSILPLNKFPIVKLFFPRRFLLSTLLTTQTKLLPLSHKLSSILLQLYNFRHFHLNHHSSSTFAIIRPTYIRIHSTFIICNLLIYY